MAEAPSYGPALAAPPPAPPTASLGVEPGLSLSALAPGSLAATQTATQFTAMMQHSEAAPEAPQQTIPSAASFASAAPTATIITATSTATVNPTAGLPSTDTTTTVPTAPQQTNNLSPAVLGGIGVLAVVCAAVILLVIRRRASRGALNASKSSSDLMSGNDGGNGPDATPRGITINSGEFPTAPSVAASFGSASVKSKSGSTSHSRNSSGTFESASNSTTVIDMSGVAASAAVLASLPFPVDENGPCALHPLATEKHTLRDCTTYKRLVQQRRFDDLERSLIAAETTARLAEASALGFEFPVNLEGPCALHPSATGPHAHTLSACRKYRLLVNQRRFADLENAFKAAATIVAAADSFSESNALSFPYILNEDAPCALHPTTTTDKAHTLGNCTTYRRLVATKKFDELERALHQASLKVAAVKKVTFASTPSPAPPPTPLPPKPNTTPSLFSSGVKSVTQTVTSRASTTSGKGYDPSIGETSYNGTYQSKPAARRGSALGQRAGVWWKNVSSGTSAKPPQRPPVGVSSKRAVRESPIPSLNASAGLHKSSTAGSERRVGSGIETDTEDGFVTAPEFSTSEAEEGYQTANSKFTGTTSDNEYFTAAEEG
ncbi:hypothetical protein HDU98_006593 [Podochytrium sp. JEL0797]|nr:hypothetical protein HDU98_006593 [Podochytrium sp. JEL0797]